MVKRIQAAAYIGGMVVQCTTCTFGSAQSCNLEKNTFYETNLYTGVS